MADTSTVGEVLETGEAPAGVPAAEEIAAAAEVPAVEEVVPASEPTTAGPVVVGEAPSPAPAQEPPAPEELRVAAGGEVCACGAVFVAGARFCRTCGRGVPEATVVEEAAASAGVPAAEEIAAATEVPAVEEVVPASEPTTAGPVVVGEAPSPAPAVQEPPAPEELRVAAGGEVCACGAVFVAGARFCRTCGRRVPEVPHCPSCGAQVGAGWRFCRSCGTGLQ